MTEIDADLLLSAYTKLSATNVPTDNISFFVDWINANEVKSNTIAKIALKLTEAIKSSYSFYSDLKEDCEKMQNTYSESQMSLQEGQKAVSAALEEEIGQLKRQVGETRSALSALNEFFHQSQASIHSIPGELSRLWLEINEVREQAALDTRQTLEECKQETTKNTEAFGLQVTESIKEIAKRLDNSLTQQKGVIDEAIRLAEFKRAQEAEYRSQAEQARITEWNNRITGIMGAQSQNGIFL